MLTASSHLSVLNMFGSVLHNFSLHHLPRDKGDADCPIVPIRREASGCARGGRYYRKLLHQKGCQALKQFAREVVESQTPEVFKMCIDGLVVTFSNLNSSMISYPSPCSF